MRKIPRAWPDPAPLFRHGDRAARGRRGWLDCAVTVNPLGPPPAALRALREGLAAAGHYPDPECRQLAQALAARHGCDAWQVIVGNGANDLLHLVTRCARPRRVAIAEPHYNHYLRPEPPARAGAV